jgi:hypothetical protein
VFRALSFVVVCCCFSFFFLPVIAISLSVSSAQGGRSRR